MSESQSRYSIIERLVTEKLKVMEEKQNIEGEILKLKERREYEKERKKDAIVSLKEQIKEKENEFLFSASEINERIVALEAGKGSKAELCDEKIVELDKAMKAVENISAEAAKEASK